MKIIPIIFFLFFTYSYSQEVNKSYCDSLFSKFESYYDGIYPDGLEDTSMTGAYWADWGIKFKGNLDSVQTSFYDEVKDLLPENEDNKLIIAVFIDSTGSVICSKIYIGINDKIDAIALEKVKYFKFHPFSYSPWRTLLILLNRKNKLN